MAQRFVAASANWIKLAEEDRMRLDMIGMTGVVAAVGATGTTKSQRSCLSESYHRTPQRMT